MEFFVERFQVAAVSIRRLDYVWRQPTSGQPASQTKSYTSLNSHCVTHRQLQQRSSQIEPYDTALHNKTKYHHGSRRTARGAGSPRLHLPRRNHRYQRNGIPHIHGARHSLKRRRRRTACHSAQRALRRSIPRRSAHSRHHNPAKCAKTRASRCARRQSAAAGGAAAYDRGEPGHGDGVHFVLNFEG